MGNFSSQVGKFFPCGPRPGRTYRLLRYVACVARESDLVSKTTSITRICRSFRRCHGSSLFVRVGARAREAPLLRGARGVAPAGFVPALRRAAVVQVAGR